ncbi:Aste57867_1506 [Aphanomyces stellatus]|uniref:Aste57867_1506 protein n=1 Tax=Aphanomyces stellatus TaxID=120398 RepID=A0A485KAT3_9STRA|nr:hypothetical protein As57867_001505 [Aphanomyces stellatus]VFT78722.1 Aste57867_1506 [Aphanomyces stellatus]
MSILVTKLSALFPIVPVDETPPFKLHNNQQCVAECLVDDSSRSRADLVDASVIQVGKDQTPPAIIVSLIPTRHLNLPDDFYSDPRRAKQLCTYRHPEHILPRYGEFIFKLLLRAHTMQYLFQFRDPQPRCVFCGANETYQHYLFATYYQIWLQRNDRTFRVDLTSKAPMDIAIHAACLVKFTLHSYYKIFRSRKDTS